MAEILVSGYYGFGNAGDEAILGGIITAFRDIDPTFRFTVISGKVANTRKVHGVEAVSRGDFRAIWDAMRRADLLLSGGGSLLQDVTGTKSIVYYLGIVTMGKLRRLPTVFYAQGIGPVNGPVGRALVPLVANAVDLIMVRDAESADAIRRLGVTRPEVRVTADAALVLPPADRAEGTAVLEQHGMAAARRPLIGVSVRPWKLTTEAALAALASGLDEVAQETGGAVLFIPMQQPHDVEAARAVAARMRSRPLLFEGEVTYRELRALTAACDVLVGMRYHALVFAAVNRVPLVGLSYDPKNDSLLRLLGEEAVGTTQQLDAGRLRAAVLEALEKAPQIRERYDRVLAQLVPRSRENARLAVELMKRWQAR